MRKPYWKYFVALYLLIALVNVISTLMGMVDSEDAPIGEDIIATLLTSVLDLMPAALIGLLVEYILRKFTKKTFVLNLAITVIAYGILSTILLSLKD